MVLKKICLFPLFLLLASSCGQLPLLKTLLSLSAEMEVGLGLLVIAHPHGLTTAQLMSRVCDVDEVRWENAARNGHLHVLQWLQSNLPAISRSKWGAMATAAAEGGHVEILRWLGSKYVNGFLACN